MTGLPSGLPAWGFGTAPLGNLYRPISDAEAEKSVAAALAGGFGYIDTAPHYGVGLAEERLGRVLAGIPRSSYVLSTKVGRVLRPLRDGEEPDPQGYFQTPPRAREWDFSRDGVLRSVESSLTRLGVDRIDIAYLHDPDDHEDEVYRTGFPALAELREQGVVGAVGAGMNQTGMLRRFVDRLDFDVVLCAGRYSLLDPSAAGGLLPLCADRKVAVVIGGVYNSGILAAPETGAHYDYAPAARPLVERALRLAEVCARHGVPLRAAALRFPFGHPAVTTVLCSGASADQVTDNLEMIGRTVPDELWDELTAEGLLPADVPVPVHGRVPALGSTAAPPGGREP
ncbi:aldo/keto reductase [Actinocorallia lasiicapitis]